MSNDYQLSTLMELREQARDEAERELGDEVGRQNEARNAVEAAKQALVDHDEEVAHRRESHRANLETSFDLRTVRQFDEYLAGTKIDREELERQIERAKKDAREADARVKKAREDLIEAEQALSAVEKHHETWKEEQAVVDRRRQADAMDEIAMTRWKKERG